MAETKIEKLVLNIHGKMIELNVEEAKELKSALSEIFGADKVVEHIYHDRYISPWRPYYGTYWQGQLTSWQGQENHGVYNMSLQNGSLQNAKC